MPKVKVPRKSTAVDMTAMCDVAFLLLSFFILTTKFKAPDALSVVTPNSVSTEIVEQKDAVFITLDKEGKVYFSMSDDAPKREVIESINQRKALNLTDQEMKAFILSGSYVGVPFEQLKSYLQKSQDQIKDMKLSGIPVDSANNHLTDWMNAAATAFAGQKMILMVKGDNEAKYLSFKGVIDAFKRNEIFKFQMVTNPEGVPPGTDLYKKRMSHETAAE